MLLLCYCRSKHPLKGDISMRGATGICIFTGIMDKHLYIEILRDTLLLFISDVHPERHCLMADNDPKHNSVAACQVFCGLWCLLVAYISSPWISTQLRTFGTN